MLAMNANAAKCVALGVQNAPTAFAMAKIAGITRLYRPLPHFKGKSYRASLIIYLNGPLC